ncbi:beta-ketoacyl synthase chain length factor [Muricoccus radiodurans]|uniref:beta-ketoacyl synthase chain length factor n=1 Tax=Muricoccus radiodurans TaxID=2231721 RepID=UPI003CF772FD
MKCWIAGAAVLGPGLPGWEASRPVLAGEAPWQDAPLTLPPPANLPPTERRRTSQAVRLAIAAAGEAAARSGLDPAGLETVFASSNGDGAVVGAILDALATPDGVISPTQFHNSVHNAAAGYWGIAVGSSRPSISLGGHDDTVATGLLQAAAGVAARGAPILFCAYDAPLIAPLDAKRPTEGLFAAALVLTPRPDGAMAAISLEMRAEAGDPRPAGPLAVLMDRNPAARALPILCALAEGRAARIPMPLVDGGALVVEVTPC